MLYDWIAWCCNAGLAALCTGIFHTRVQPLGEKVLVQKRMRVERLMN